MVNVPYEPLEFVNVPDRYCPECGDVFTEGELICPDCDHDLLIHPDELEEEESS